MNMNSLARLLGTALLVNLCACSTIKEMFPDKEKDYQFTTEIPKLIIPSDLGSGKPSSTPSTSSASSQSAEAATTTEPEPEKKTEASETSSATTADDQPVINPGSITVDILESTNHISYLRINTPFNTAWRLVSKGLSRQSIEVSDRNEADRTFKVQYDPEEKKIEDGSFSDELEFMMNGFQSNDKEYLLKLVETNGQTDVVILNDEQKPTADEGGLKLLKVLRQSIKTNLAGK